MGSTLYAIGFSGRIGGIPEEQPSTSSIKEAFLRAEEGFGALSQSKLYSQEALFAQSIVLRELSILGLDDGDLTDVDFQVRRKQCLNSCELLESLSTNNPRVQKYEAELIRSQACFYRVAFKPESKIFPHHRLPLLILQCVRRWFETSA